MGVLNVSTGGSFPVRNKTFGAMEHGHAHAVIDAIEFLVRDVLPAAVEQDFKLLEQGLRPAKDYYKEVGA